MLLYFNVSIRRSRNIQIVYGWNCEMIDFSHKSCFVIVEQHNCHHSSADTVRIRFGLRYLVGAGTVSDLD